MSSGNSISLKTIIEFYRNELNSNSAINYGVLPYRENEVMDLRCSVGKLLSIIYSSCPIEQALFKMIQ